MGRGQWESSRAVPSGSYVCYVMWGKHERLTVSTLLLEGSGIHCLNSWVICSPSSQEVGVRQQDPLTIFLVHYLHVYNVTSSVSCSYHRKSWPIWNIQTPFVDLLIILLVRILEWAPLEPLLRVWEGDILWHPQWGVLGNIFWLFGLLVESTPWRLQNPLVAAEGHSLALMECSLTACALGFWSLPQSTQVHQILVYWISLTSPSVLYFCF